MKMMRSPMQRLKLVLAALLMTVALNATEANEAHAFEAADGTYFSFDVQIMGGVVFDWSALDEAGNQFALTLGVDWYHFRVALGVAGVLPASNVEGSIESVWVEGLWYPFGAFYGLVTPYVVAGMGVVTADSIDEPRAPDAVPPPAVRWSPRNPRFLGMLGIGVSYGDVQGLYGSLDFRAYNHTHGGFNLGIGYRF